jgi:hypothetical protein
LRTRPLSGESVSLLELEQITKHMYNNRVNGPEGRAWARDKGYKPKLWGEANIINGELTQTEKAHLAAVADVLRFLGAKVQRKKKAAQDAA